MSALFSIANYLPPGPVAATFIQGAEIVPFLMGPVGSGKTNATIFKMLRYVALMPRCRDGVVRAKAAVVRTDYRTLYSTTLATWWQWFPKDYPGGKFVGGADRPAVHELTFTTPRGRKIELTVEFKALGDNRIEDLMRGWEGTLAWLNEADLLAESALNFLLQRTPRFPRAADLEAGAVLKPLVIGDLNPPGDPDHWIVKHFIDNPKPGFRLYQQPSGMSPQAENVKNLPAGYYDRLNETLPEWDKQRFVHGRIGYDRSGLPVYPEFDPRFNLSPTPLKPIPGVPIYLGLDISGLHPAGVIIQRAPNLQVRVLEEFYYGHVGPTRFGEMMAAGLEERYRECPVSLGFYDPSNDYGADKEGGEQSWIDIVRKALGVTLVPAPSNEVPFRVESVRNLLMLPISADVRGLIVSSDRCPMLVKGFMSHYRYKLNPDGSVQNRHAPRPEKNDYSNPHDALQYVCSGLIGRAGVVASAAKGYRPGALGVTGKASRLGTDFSVFS